MNIKTGIIATAIILSLSAGAFAAEYVMLKPPYLQNVKQDEITIMWETSKEGPSVVEYGETTKLGKKIEIPDAVTIHEVTIKGLERGKNYFYIASTGDAKGRGKFHTDPGPGVPFKIAVWGDNRTDFFTHTKVAKAIAKAEPDLAINVGDVVTRGEEYDQWGREYFIPIKSFSGDVPTFISIGNHEENSDWYYKFVSQPGNEAWFSTDYGNAHIVIFDSNQDYKPGSEQYEWLGADLASDAAQNADWLLVFKHHPEFSEGWDAPGYSGEAALVEHLIPLYEKYGVDMVFGGHTHDYERGQLNGVIYVVSGGGGSKLDSFQQDIENMTVYAAEYQYCLLSIDGKKLKFESITPEGKILDSLELKK